MAQQKRKRKRKHRGTPAGTIERHAHETEKRRTGVKPEAAKSGRERRIERLSQPPSWRGAFNRAAIAAALFAILVIVAFGENPATGVFLALIVIPLYWVTGYWMDRFRYNRVMKRKETGG
jgi:hypothetical protein